MHSQPPAIVWFRHDLRLKDNPALNAAVQTSRPVIAIFIYDREAMKDSDYGAAGKWWLHHNLAHLQIALKDRGVHLAIRTGNSADIIQKIIEETGATSLFYNRIYEPWSIKRDKDIKALFTQKGIEVQSFSGHYLFEPWTIKNKSGDPYKIFTPFYKACLAQEDRIGEPLAAPGTMTGYRQDIAHERQDVPGFIPAIRWDKKMETHWESGESAAHNRLNAFLDNGLTDYKDGRDRPDRDKTSSLSPYLRFGIISPRAIWHTTRAYAYAHDIPENQTESFLRELIWREFCNHLLYYFPDMPVKPLQGKFENFPWKRNVKHRTAWQKGLTGYPIVDAGMRQLWETGWMHNRVRMIAGSLLVKHLLQPWQDGEAWFMDCLIDGDPANNSAGWQWIAGCGADAAPYFRIFNPILQGEKFDPGGDYVRRFVPELRNMPGRYIHRPWEAPEDILVDAGVTLGETYPFPVVDHKAGRARAMEAFDLLQKSDTLPL